VGITAGCDCVSAGGSVLIGAICGVLMIFAVDFIDKVLHVDDPDNITVNVPPVAFSNVPCVAQ
jgi:ammonia channel protein AmtB